MANNFADNDNMTALMTAVGNKLGEKAKIFYGDDDAWNALSLAEKKEYDYWASPEESGGRVTSKIITKLWENPDPTVAFAAQNITLASDDYDFLLIIAKASTSSGTSLFSDIIPKGWDLNLSTAVSDSSKGIVIRRRNVTYVSDTEYYIANGATVNSVENTTSTSNGICVPVFVYGIKANISAGISADHCIMSDGTSAEDAINDLNMNNLDSHIRSLSGYTQSNPYVFPSDGYVFYELTRSGDYADLFIMGANTPQQIRLCDSYTDHDVVNSVFVRKGMRGYAVPGSIGIYRPFVSQND